MRYGEACLDANLRWLDIKKRGHKKKKSVLGGVGCGLLLYDAGGSVGAFDNSDSVAYVEVLVVLLDDGNDFAII